MLDAAYDASEHDTRNGRSSLLIAQSGHDVTALNVRARTARINGTTFVKNGDTWTVHRVHRNDDLTIRADQRTKGVVRLSRHYVVSHVELGYTTTATRAQGRTVDTTHVLIDDSTTAKPSTWPPPEDAQPPTCTYRTNSYSISTPNDLRHQPSTSRTC